MEEEYYGPSQEQLDAWLPDMYNHATQMLLHQKMSREDAIEAIKSNGVPHSYAEGVVDNTLESLADQKNEAFMASIKTIGIALLMVLAGILFTSLSETRIYIGLMVVGGWYVIKGLIAFINYFGTWSHIKS